MKIMIKLLSFFLIFILLLAALYLILLRPSDIRTFDGENIQLDFQEKLLQSEMNLYGISHIVFSEKEINALLSDKIVHELNALNLTSLLMFESVYIQLTKDCVVTDISSAFSYLPLTVRLCMIPVIDDERVGLKFIDIRLGKIPISLSSLNYIGLELEKDLFLIPASQIPKEITLSDISVSDKKIKFYFATNNHVIINTYLKNEDQIAAKELLNILKKDKDSQEFANILIKILMQKEQYGHLSNESKSEIVRAFKALDTMTQARLILLIAKYKFDDILEILTLSSR